MRIIVSPAKKMKRDPDGLPVLGLPPFLPKTEELLRTLKGLSPEELKQVSGLRVFFEPGLRNQTGVLSVVPGGKDVERIGAVLAENGVAVRAGMHCAPLAHDSAGTLKTGTVRISVSDLNTLEECVEFLQIFKKILT